MRDAAVVPATPDALVRPLAGWSGAQVHLMSRDDRHWFVRKTARDPDGSPRLRRQMEKQAAFASDLDQLIRTPEILDAGEIDGRFYFDMQFVQGTDGVTFLRRAGYGELALFTDRLCDYLSAAVGIAAVSESAASMFGALYAKLVDVHRRVPGLDARLVADLLLALDRVRLNEPERPTLCHGDLTLENLVVDAHGVIWALDCLDAPFEHVWLDVAKLHQDLSGGWYQRSHPTAARYVLEYVGGRVLETAAKVDASYPLVHAVLMAYTFVRILPYTSSQSDFDFVLRRIRHFARVAVGGAS